MAAKNKDLSEEDKKRNKRFEEAYQYLYKKGKVSSKGDFALKIGASKDTITNTFGLKNRVSDEVLFKLLNAYPEFNQRWLFGNSLFMMDADVPSEDNEQGGIDQSSLVNAIMASKDETIATKDNLIASKVEIIASLKREIKTKDEMIVMLKEKVDELKHASQPKLPKQQEQPKLEETIWPTKPMGVAEEGDRTLTTFD